MAQERIIPYGEDPKEPLLTPIPYKTGNLKLVKGIESVWQIPCRRCGALVSFSDAQNALLDEWGNAHAFCSQCGEENSLFLPSSVSPLPKRTHLTPHPWVSLLLVIVTILAMVLLLLPVFQPTPKRKHYDPELFTSASIPENALEISGGKK